MVKTTYTRKTKPYVKKTKKSTRKSGYKRPAKGSKSSKMLSLIPQGPGGMITRFSIHKKAHPKVALFKMIGSSNYININFGQRLNIVPGLQSAQVFSYCTGGAIGAPADVQGNDFELIRATIGTDKTLRFLFESVNAQVRLSNAGTTTQEVYIYDILCKSGTSVTALACWINGLSDQSTAPPVAGSISSVLTAGTVGCLPTMSQYFNQFYSIKKRTRLILSQGQMHTHTVNLTPNKIFDSELLESSDSFLSGLSVVTMFVSIGMPDNDSVVKTNATVTTGSGALDFVMTKTLKYTFIQDAQQNTYGISNLPLTYTTAESVFNIGNGSATAVSYS